MNVQEHVQNSFSPCRYQGAAQCGALTPHKRSEPVSLTLNIELGLGRWNMRGLKIIPVKLLLVALLLLSTTANAQWTKVPVPTTSSLRGLSLVGENILWASGTGGTVLHTVDGGKSWSVVTIPGAEKLDFRGIHAFDDKNAVIMSSGKAEEGQARIYRTNDGGESWSQVFEQTTPGIFFDGLAFWDRKHGIVLSDPVDGHFVLFTTDDGGLSWKQISAPAVPPSSLPKEGAFAASNSCLAVQGDKNVWFATGGASVARVFRSNDRGKSWSIAETPMHPANASSGIFSLAFQDAKNGIAVGGDYEHPESSDLPSVMSTQDGGETWQAAKPTDPKGLYFSTVALHGDQITATGIKGIWTNSGTWKNESTDNLNSVVAGGRTIWAVGPKGMVLRQAIH
jgi:photosystem II stability/assembly factor-like uncharacterized protein